MVKIQIEIDTDNSEWCGECKYLSTQLSDPFQNGYCEIFRENIPEVGFGTFIHQRLKQCIDATVEGEG